VVAPPRSVYRSISPLLLIYGIAEHAVPDVVTRSTFKQYRDSAAITRLKQFEGRGHSPAIDSGWRDVAHAVLDWIKTQSVGQVYWRSPSS
jgi:hypothetical protein